MDIVVTASRHPQPGETLMGREIHFLPGGKGENQAVASARSGTTSTLVAVVGDDANGHAIRSFLRKHGVDLTHVRIHPTLATGTAVCMVGGGESAVVVVTGANQDLRAEDVRAVAVDPGDVLVSQFETAQETVRAFFERGKSSQATTILNPSPVDEFPHRLWGLSDVVVVNELEFEVICASRGIRGGLERRLAEASSLLATVEQALIVTLGAAGCVVVTRDEHVTIPGRTVEVVDTTGAGDCFLGFMAGELARGARLRDAAEVANCAASLCVGRTGAASSVPSDEEVRAAGP